jgi:acyl-coenzyme A synthetase/AMP-(fatty) acid ligase
VTVTASGAEVVFTTSGTTGEPVVWLRTVDQLRTEARLVADTVLGPVDAVVTFAPRAHLYGHLFGEVLPSLLGVSVIDRSTDPLEPPPFVPGQRTLYVCLPSSWPVLRRSLPAEADLTGSFALHSTGPVSPETRPVVQELTARGLRATELLGSTETGGIAYRDLDGDPDRPWRLLPDVSLVDEPGPDGTCLLHVRSPRIARRSDQLEPAASHRLGDVIQPIDAQRFVLLGRSNRLVKINGRRTDLAAVEAALAAAVPGIDAVCVAVGDPLRGEHYELFYVGDPDLDDRIADALAGLPKPRAVHRVDRIPRTITGKVKIDRLFALADGVDRP